MNLAAQDIAHYVYTQGMIRPFSPERHVVNGKSWGLSAASYDVRIAHDLTLGPDPGKVLARICRAEPDPQVAFATFHEAIEQLPESHALAHTIENFNMPWNVMGVVCDKSSYARVFVSAFNTLFDPGFRGNATLELVNLGDTVVEIKAGDPICQIEFRLLTQPTDRPYNGKYQDQPSRPVAAIHED